MRKADLDRLVEGALYTGPVVTADRLVGLDACLRQLEGQIAIFGRPDLALRFGLEPSGTLFVGPPGTGKTLTARYVAGRSDRRLYQVSADEFGSDPDLLHGLFRRLSEEQAILFIDEVGILGRRRAWGQPDERRMLSAFLTALDGLATVQAPERLWVIGACTEDVALDPAIHRSGRLGVVIEFAAPSEEQRRQLFRLYLERLPNDISDPDIAQLAAFANEATGADIADWVRQAASESLADNANGEPTIALRHLEAVVNRRGFVAAKGRPDREPGWDTAIHEAGHAVIAHDLLGAEALAKVAIGWGQSASRIGGSFRGHFELSAEWVASHGPDSTSWVAHAAVDLAGTCAEEVILGVWGAGARSDFAAATDVVVNLLERGDPDFGPTWAGMERAIVDSDDGVGSEEMRSLAWRLSRQRLETAREWARMLVAARREAIERLAHVLFDERALLGADEIVAIIGPAPPVQQPEGGPLVWESLELSSLPTASDCTHRSIAANHATESGQPMPFWSCTACGRRFVPTAAVGA